MNVMLFIVDDLNDWVGCLGGHPQAQTPSIDRLADRGVLFTNAHCNGVNCNASRSSFLTGVYPSTSGVYLNRTPWRASPTLASVRALPQHFQLNGYTTGKAGKVFHRPKDFDLWDEIAPLRSDHDTVTSPEPPKLTGVQSAIDWAAIDQTDEAFFDHRMTTWMLSLIHI